MNTIVNNKTGHFNKYDTKGVYKLVCINCGKLYIGQTNRNFKTRFKKHKKDFIFGEGLLLKIEEGHEMRNRDNIKTILYTENNHEKINKLEEIKILKATTLLNMLNNITMAGTIHSANRCSQLTARFQLDNMPKERQKHFNNICLI